MALDPRDRAFLAATVYQGVLTEAQARELAMRYRGAPGRMADALVERHIISLDARAAIDASALAVSSYGGDPSATNRSRPGTTQVDPRGLADAAARLPAPTRPLPQTPWRPPPDSTITAADGPDFDAPSQDSGLTPPPLGPSTPGSGGPGGGPTHAGGLAPGGLGGQAGQPRIPGYELESELGRGGMGVVYRARSLKTGELVALKVLLDTNDRHKQRFRREADALMRMKHPGIVELVETGEASEGFPFIVMAYLPGGDFRGAMAKGLFDEKGALRVMAQVARAIAYAHTQNVLHRDLKPANILLDDDLRPRVTDFGLAKILDHESQLTRTGVALGTPQFMAPEQVRGVTDPTPAVDAYAIGVMVFVIMTGELPHPGTGAALMQAIVTVPPPRPWAVKPGVDRKLALLVLACLEKHPDDRPTCLAIADGLDAWLDGHPLSITPPSMRRARQRALVIGLAITALLAVLAVAFLVWQRHEHETYDPEEVEAALKPLREALGEARRLRGTPSHDGLLREAEAHRAAARVLAMTPPVLMTDARAIYEHAGAAERRAEVLAALLSLTIAAGDAERALALAREHQETAPGPMSQALLARAMAAAPATRSDAVHLAIAAAKEARGGDPEVARAVAAQAALVLISLARPAQAAAALDLPDLPPALLALRGRAFAQAGDVARARADLDAVVAADRADVVAQIALARLDLEAGQPRPALARLDSLRSGGGDPAWHAARGRALAALGQPATARRALDEAIRLAPALSAERGRFHLRRGRVAQGLADLTSVAAVDTAARLDVIVAAWLQGGPDDAALEGLGQLTQAARACAATPAIGAGAARWQSRIELARGQSAAAIDAARRATEVDPSPASAAALALTLLRAGRAAEALAALGDGPRTPEGVAVAAAALLAGDGPDRAAAAEAAAKTIPESSPAHADAARALAALRGAADAARAAERRADAMRRVERGNEGGGRPCPVPVASEEPAAGALEAAARLFHEARRAQALARRDGDGKALVRRLLARAVALDPAHVPARLAHALADGDLGAVERAAQDHPHVVDIRRARLRMIVARDGDVALPAVDADLPLLREADLRPGERLRLARLLHAAGRDDEARAFLAPALEALPHHAPAFELGLRLFAADGARLAALRAALAELEVSRREEAAIRQRAVVTETVLTPARDALERWERDLPHDEEYWLRRSRYEQGSMRPNRSIRAAGEWVVAASGNQMIWTRVAYFTWAYGYIPITTEAETAIDICERESAAHPESAAPFAGRALYLLARSHISRQPSPEDPEAAADAALHAVDLAPLSHGVLVLAADALVECGDDAEAMACLARAFALDDSRYAGFIAARIAARRGDVARAIELLDASGRPDRTEVAGYAFEKDPCFTALMKDETFKAYLAR